jgi:hypothetical protein
MWPASICNVTETKTIVPAGGVAWAATGTVSTSARSERAAQKEIESEACPEKIANESALQHGMLRSKSIGNPSALIRVPKKILPKLRFGDCGVRSIPISKNL